MIPVQTFPISTFEQSNPGLVRMKYMSDLASSLMQNVQQFDYLRTYPATLDEQLKQMQSNTSILGAQAQYAQPMEQAKLATQQAMPNVYGAQADEARAHAGLYGQQAKEAAMNVQKTRQLMDLMKSAYGDDSASTYNQGGGGATQASATPTLGNYAKPSVMPQSPFAAGSITPAAGRPQGNLGSMLGMTSSGIPGMSFGPSPMQTLIGASSGQLPGMSMAPQSMMPTEQPLMSAMPQAPAQQQDMGQMPTLGSMSSPSIMQQAMPQQAMQVPQGMMPQQQTTLGQQQAMQQAQGMQGPQLSPQQQRMMRLADVMAMMKGETPPTVAMANKMAMAQQEMQNKIHEAQTTSQTREAAKNAYAYSTKMQEGQAKDMETMATESAKSAALAQNNMNNIREMLKYRDAAMIKGWFADEFPKIAKADPNYVAALKSGMQLNLSGIKDLAASHTGRILESMTDAIQTGTPRPGIPESAARALGEQLMVANQMVIKRNDYIQQYKDIIPDPNRLSTAISNVFLKNNPVDEHGNIHPEMVDKLDKVATPERMKMEAYPLNYVRMRMPNGSVGKVSRDSVNELIQQGGQLLE